MQLGTDCQLVQPPIVLAADQVQRPAVEPGDDQRPVFCQRAIHIGRGQPAGPGADGKARPARILSLDGQQPARDVNWASGPVPGQQLRSEPARRKPAGRRVVCHLLIMAEPADIAARSHNTEVIA